MTELELAKRYHPINVKDQDFIVSAVSETKRLVLYKGPSSREADRIQLFACLPCVEMLKFYKAEVLCKAAADIDVAHFGGRMMYVSEAAQHLRELARGC